MSDLTPEAPAAEAPAEAPVTTPEAEAPVETPSGEGAPATGFALDPEDLDGEIPAEVKQFEASYVQKVRGQAAKFRTSLRPYEEAFEGYEAEDRDAILTLARELQENPDTAARRMLEASRAIAGDRFDDWLNGAEPEYLTPEALDARLAEREAAQRQEAEVAAIQKEAIDLGYTADSPDHAKLFWIAANQTNGDLKAADAAIKAERQSIIDAYVAEIREKGQGFPTTPTQVTGAPSNQGENNTPRTMREASDRFRERLAALDSM